MSILSRLLMFEDRVDEDGEAHRLTCRCWRCRHERFNPGPSSASRKKRRAVGHRDAKRRP